MNLIIPREEYKSKHKFFKKGETDLYLQKFYNYINITENKGLFTCLQGKYEKERYLDLKKYGIKKCLIKTETVFLLNQPW